MTTAECSEVGGRVTMIMCQNENAGLITKEGDTPSILSLSACPNGLTVQLYDIEDLLPPPWGLI